MLFIEKICFMLRVAATTYAWDGGRGLLFPPPASIDAHTKVEASMDAHTEEEEGRESMMLERQRR
jgi:translation elongation factor EF-Tu-like GTPase